MPKRNLYRCYRSTIHNGQNLDSAKVWTSDQWISKMQDTHTHTNIISPHNAKLFSFKNEILPFASEWMLLYVDHYVEWNTETQIPHSPSYVSYIWKRKKNLKQEIPVCISIIKNIFGQTLLYSFIKPVVKYVIQEPAFWCVIWSCGLQQTSHRF